MVTKDFSNETKALIDNLKSVCANYGLGNDGNEYKIITQIFLYKFMNDKFGYEVKQLDPKLAKAAHWEDEISKYSEKEYKMLLLRMSPDSAKLQREHFIAYLHNRQNEDDFHKLFDDTLRDIAVFNNAIFSVKTGTGVKITLFDELSQFIADSSQRDAFCKALIAQLVEFSFEGIFKEKFDFFSTIFEYLIKDYNKDGGGKYAEYYTPRAVSKIMAAILVDGPTNNVTCYDPAAGTGQLLMSLAHAIGEDRCTIYSQDISQKSSSMLRLNLVLNNLVHSIQNIIKGNTIKEPYKSSDWPEKFDYIVTNPPFKLDFSDYREDLDAKANKERFFAGVPKVPKKKKESMAIYLLFIQHVMDMLADKGKAAIVVPTGFVTAKNGIEKKILSKFVSEKMLLGVLNMPSNIFATTGTSVSVIFLDKTNTKGGIVLMDASKLGRELVTEDGKKTVLQVEEEKLIVDGFMSRQSIDGFSVVVSYDDIKRKRYSLSAGQYFDVKIAYKDISELEFQKRMRDHSKKLNALFEASADQEKEIRKHLSNLIYA